MIAILAHDVTVLFPPATITLSTSSAVAVLTFGAIVSFSTSSKVTLPTPDTTTALSTVSAIAIPAFDAIVFSTPDVVASRGIFILIHPNTTIYYKKQMIAEDFTTAKLYLKRTINDTTDA